MEFILFVIVICILYYVTFRIYTIKERKKQRENDIIAKKKIREYEAFKNYKEAAERYKKSGSDYDRQTMLIYKKTYISIVNKRSND